MGGGSSVMGMVALRGMPADYDGWAELGAAGWGWNEVLPFFRKLETDTDFHGDLHGDSGPIPHPPHADGAMAAADARHRPLCGRTGSAAHRRHEYGDFRDGHGSLPMSNTPTAARVDGDELSRCQRARAQEPYDHDRRDG